VNDVNRRSHLRLYFLTKAKITECYAFVNALVKRLIARYSVVPSIRRYILCIWARSS